MVKKVEITKKPHNHIPNKTRSLMFCSSLTKWTHYTMAGLVPAISASRSLYHSVVKYNLSVEVNKKGSKGFKTDVPK